MIFTKKPQDSNTSLSQKVIGFEPEDKPTPTAGKLLLFIMAVLLIFLGVQGLRDIENIPTKPTPLSYCADSGLNTTFSNLSTNNCQFSKYEVKYKIPEIYKKYESTIIEISNLNKQKSNLNSQIYQLDSQISTVQREYDLSLQENIANEDTRIGQTPEQLRQRVQSLQNQKQTLQASITPINAELNKLEPITITANKELEAAVKKARSDYNHDKAIYNFKVFLIQSIFVFPLFFIFLKIYMRFKSNDSPHTVIATTLVGVSGLFVLGITISYLWSTFLQDILKEIFTLIADLPLFRTVFYYFAMLCIIVIFGGAVYHLQKKIFDPTRVQLRRLRSKKCPYCEFPFGFTKDFCPSCGKQLMEKCSKCPKQRYTIMKHCPNCGSEQS